LRRRRLALAAGTRTRIGDYLAGGMSSSVSTAMELSRS